MDKPHFTPEQIDEYCKTIHGFTTPPMTGTEVWIVKGVQIIKQLQEELARRDERDKQSFEALRACSLSAKE